MRRLSRVGSWVAASATIAMTACASPSAPDGSWLQVSEQTTCEALLPTDCVGIYGFSVSSDGQYTVGPAESGQSLTGRLSEAEQSALSADAAAVAAHLGDPPECESGPIVAGVSDRVDLVDARQGRVRVYDQGGTPGSVCTRGGRDRATKLHADLAALMARYYPRPFPAP